MMGFDIICISESWLHDNISNTLLKFNGYNSFRRDNPGNSELKQRGGGLLVYVKEALYVFSNIIPLLCNIPACTGALNNCLLSAKMWYCINVY